MACFFLEKIYSIRFTPFLLSSASTLVQVAALVLQDLVDVHDGAGKYCVVPK